MDVKTGQILALADYPTSTRTSSRDYAGERVRLGGAPGRLRAGQRREGADLRRAASTPATSRPRTKIEVPADAAPRRRRSSTTSVSHGTLHAHGGRRRSPSRPTSATVLAAHRCPTRSCYDYLTKLRPRQPTDVGLGGESHGHAAAAGDWLQITRDNIAFGQGLSVNAVQMAAAISAIANGGVYVEPSLVEAYVDSDGHVTPADGPASTHRVVSEHAAHEVARMMEAVVGAGRDRPDGATSTATAWRARPEPRRRSTRTAAATTASKVVSFAGLRAGRRPALRGVRRRPGPAQRRRRRQPPAARSSTT